MRPPPKLASVSPVFRSNLKIGSTGLLSQLTGAPAPKLPAPQRSYAQMCPSFGSMSTPALEPHCRPSGSVPQFLVTFGAGFGNPSPVMGFPVAPTGGASVFVAQPARKSTAQRNRTDFRAPIDVMTSPFTTAKRSVDPDRFRKASAPDDSPGPYLRCFASSGQRVLVAPAPELEGSRAAGRARGALH